MSKYVYLVGPICGCDKGEANDWRQYVIEALPEGIVGVSPLRCEPMVGEKYELVYEDPRFGTAAAISGKNFMDTTTCDLILAYLPAELNQRRPSYGSIFEIGWATAMRKPVILVTDDDYLAQHPLVQRNIDWVLPDLDQALEVIEGVLSVYAVH